MGLTHMDRDPTWPTLVPQIDCADQRSSQQDLSPQDLAGSQS